jgi:peptidoglycan/LPS O-acetylase OafA/YrhL
MLALGLTWGGVDLFFVLSGFLLGGTLLEQRESPRYFTTFYLRRAFRILPPCFILLFLLQCGVFDQVTPSIQEKAQDVPWWSHWTFVQNFFMTHSGSYGPFGQSWSLAVEEQFYLLLPLIIRLTSVRQLWIWLVLGVVSATLIRLTYYWLHPHGLLAGYVLLPCRWDSLLLGVMAAWALRQTKWRPWLQSPAGIRASWMVLSVSLCVLAVLGIKSQKTASYGMTAGGYTMLGIASVCVLLLAHTLEEGHWLRRILRTRWLIFMGAVSYTVYLWHPHFISTAWHLVGASVHEVYDWATVGAAVGSLAACLVFAWVSYHLLERPLMRLGHSFRY